MDRNTVVTLRTGSKMPIIGVGTWQMSHDTAGTITEALKMGYRMIDTSGDYGTQPGVGEGVEQSGVAREQIFLTTKIEETDADAYASAQHNLDELQQDYADLILIHRPPSSTDTSIELWEGLIHAKNDALTRDIGVSNYSIEQIQELIDATGEVPAVNQIEWSPFGHSEDMLEFCRQEGIIIQAYSPLTRQERMHDATIADLAAMYRKTPAQILLRWCIQLGVIPIPKANKVEHLRENLTIFDFELSPDDIATLNGLNEEYSTFGALPYL
jgi:diketogulonate reductase-like aldo/keto reductase